MPGVRHVVMFRFKEDTTQEQLDDLKAGLLEMVDTIGFVKGYQMGWDLKLPSGQTHPAGRNCDFMWQADFGDVAKFEEYVIHPAHQQLIVEKIKPILVPGSRFAIQYELPESTGAAPAASKKEKAKKKEEQKKDNATPAAVDPEKARKDLLKKVTKEGGKRGVEIEGAADMGGLQFFCTAVEFPDGDTDLLVESMNAMNAQSDPTEEERKGGSGAIGKMIFSAGPDQLGIVAYVPEAKQGDVSCKEWLECVLTTQKGELLSAGKDISVGRVKADPEKGLFPIKIREGMIIEANNFLRKKGLFPDDDSDDDEMVFGDDDFPSAD